MNQIWKKNVTARFDVGAENYDAYSDVQRQVAARLASKFPALERPNILEIGCGSGALTSHLFKRYPDGKFQITDISPRMLELARGNVAGDSVKASWSVMDGECPDVTGGFDLIVSNMSFQWFEDITGAVERLRGLLNPNGVIYYTMPGADCFKEWKDVLKELGLSSGLLEFQAPEGVFDQEHICIAYGNGLEFLRSMKRVGAGTPRAGYQPLGYKDLRSAIDAFDGRATWHISYGFITK